MLKILVTGGEGFIGSWIVEKLSQMGHRVTTLDSGETYDVIQREDLDRLYFQYYHNENSPKFSKEGLQFCQKR